MKDYSQAGRRLGRPAYRTPASFRYRKYWQNIKNRIKKTNSSTSK